MNPPAVPFVRRLPPGSGVLLVAVVGAFLPQDHMPSFDALKLVVLTLFAPALGLLAMWRRAPGEGETLLRDPLLLVPLVLAGAAAVGALAAWPRGSLVGPATAVTALAVARFAADRRPAEDAFRSTMRAAAFASFGVGVYAVFQALGLDPAPWGARREVVSTLGNTSFAAEWQVAALPFAAVLFAEPKHRLDRALGAAAFVLGVTHLVLAKSRIDFVALGAAAVVFALLRMPRGRPRAVVAVVAAVAVVGAGALFFAAATGGTSLVGRSDTLAIRLRIWEGTVRAFLDAPFRLGTQPFVDVYPPFRPAEEYRASLGRDVDTPHCDVLEIATTTGVVGLVVALGVAVLLARRVSAISREHRVLGPALGASAAALVVSGLASSPLSHPATALLGAFLLGHAAALLPRPLALPAPSARRTALVLLVLSFAAFWPGPAFRGLRSDSFLALGRAERESGDATRAFLLLDAASAADPQAYAARFELGTALLHARESELAVAALRQAQALRPNDPECRVNLVYALRAAGRADEAVALLDESLRAVPWHPLLLAARAGSSLSRGDTASALADLEVAIPLTEAFDLRPRALRAEVLLARGADEAARAEALETLVLLFRREDFATMRRAAAAFARRDPLFLAVLGTRAGRVVADDPNLAAALVLAPLAETWVTDAGFLDTAAKVVRQAGDAGQATLLTGLADGVRAREALASGDLERAMRLAKSAGSRAPSPQHHVLEALCHARYGERAAVQEALAAAAALGPLDADAIRADPAIARLLPDPEIERSLERGRPKGAVSQEIDAPAAAPHSSNPGGGSR